MSAPSPSPAPASVDAAPAPAGRRRPGRRAAVLAGVLAVALVAALVLAAFLWRSTDAWQGHSAAWEDKARDHAEQVAGLEVELEGTRTDLAVTRDQLATATARITELADEKAQLGDEQVVAEQYLDYQRRVSEAAGGVATALGHCTAAQSQLIGYLGNRDAYDPADLDRFAGDVQALCDEANEANTRLQQELAQ
jgi:septal ring factor EnvC (AmiA/AmiB activator)